MKIGYSSNYQQVLRKLEADIKGLLQYNAKLFK